MSFEVPTEQKKLRDFIKRRHPEYAELVAHWDFLEATYRGGRAWFAYNLFKYLKEGEGEFNDRLERAYRFNHTREVVDLVNKYIFRGDVLRNEKDAPESVTSFWKNTTRDGKNIDQFMRLVSIQASMFGRIWVVVDNTAEEKPDSVAEEKAMDARCYSYFVKPQNVLDLSYDDMGNLNWILIYEEQRDDENPFESSGKSVDYYRLWTRDKWYLFKSEKKGNSIKVTPEGNEEHDLGVVPVIPVDHMDFEASEYSAPALIGDIAYLDRAVANYLSNLDAIIQDQTFSQLAMPAQNLMPGEEDYQKLIETGTKRIFTYDGGEGGSAPFYLSPDPKQATVIITVINKIINEIYHSVGMAGERTKQDNAVGIDNSSGVAKAYDFERMNALLVAKADALDSAENRIIELVMKWHGKDAPKDDLVKYPESYDVRGLYDEFEVASRLALIEAPDGARKEQMKKVIEKLFPRIAKELKDKMLSEVEDWSSEQDSVTAPSLIGPKEKRQGQVVGDDSKEAEAS
jgi:hypothetical protein